MIQIDKHRFDSQKNTSHLKVCDHTNPTWIATSRDYMWEIIGTPRSNLNHKKSLTLQSRVTLHFEILTQFFRLHCGAVNRTNKDRRRRRVLMCEAVPVRCYVWLYASMWEQWYGHIYLYYEKCNGNKAYLETCNGHTWDIRHSHKIRGKTINA